MSLPGHRRTSSHKRRRASHFALSKPSLTTDKAGRTHRMHIAAPGAIEWKGIAIHVKGAERKLRKALAKTQPAQAKHDHAHDHDHDHSHDHDHGSHK
jgi:hypothetical protein